MTFLNNIITDLLSKNSDLSQFKLVLPGKRPIVFIRKILEEKGYSGFLPDFFTIEDLIKEIADLQELKGVALWLFSFNIYQKIESGEEFSEFLKWFPTLQKDWDEILKFSENETQVLSYMLDEERIKNWGEDLGDENSPRKKNLNFWRKMNVFLPELKKQLIEKNWATSGMIHEIAKSKIDDFVKSTEIPYVFCGFNALTPVEEKLVRSLLQWDKAVCYFQADAYYMDDERQESGKFLRSYTQWKEFNESRDFHWIDDDFKKPKNINVFEVSGNITQTKVLPEIFSQINDKNLDNTAVVLLDENLLPASLDALGGVEQLNITMGFPLKNLAFSNAVKHLFYIQKQLEKGSSSYYYNDLLSVFGGIPNDENDTAIIRNFSQQVLEKNMVYLSKKRLEEFLGSLSYFQLFMKPKSALEYLDIWMEFCQQLKFKEVDDIQFENIAHFEKTFRIIKNQIQPYQFNLKIETLEVLINQIINKETIDFQGEPLQGLQIMGLLETRLLNFKNIILLSVNEGNLPLGNTQNTYLPFDVRSRFGLHTFLENDGIYAYHFYRLLQDSQNVYLLYNALTSGVNTGEKSRFITQIEMESNHKVENIIIQNASEPVENPQIVVEKTPVVLDLLETWKQRVSASHLTSYLYDPIQFYFNYVLKTKEAGEIEEELSQRNYGNIVHYSLQELYELIKGKILSVNDLENLFHKIDEAIDNAIIRLNHQPEFYEKGMNYIHKSIAKRVIENIIKYDLELVKSGSALEIIDLERNFENVNFSLNEEGSEDVSFYGYIDRIDRLDGVIRVIDYKSGKSKNLKVNFKGKEEDKLMNDDYKQALQLCIYLYYLKNYSEFSQSSFEAGIWSFAEVNSGLKTLILENGDLDTAMVSIKNLILEILNPELKFEERNQPEFDY